jgi:hypothetical protein
VSNDQLDRIRLNRIETDLQLARTVIYLEGKTDQELLLALAAVTRPSSGIHKSVAVVGLKTDRQGGKEVQALLRVAEAAGLIRRPGEGGVFGIIDGDSRELKELQASFLPPHQGSLFSWPTYCIENLLSTAWPKAWGAEPNWATVLSDYIPYAALNRVHVQLQSALQTLRLAKFHTPSTEQALRTVVEVKAELARDKKLLAERDVEEMFDGEVSKLRSAIESSLEEGHALINGKWLVSHYAAQLQPGRSPDALRTEWAKSVLSAGGHPAVRDLWTRIAGEAP